jgi:hypothetical protein
MRILIGVVAGAILGLIVAVMGGGNLGGAGVEKMIVVGLALAGGFIGSKKPKQ